VPSQFSWVDHRLVREHYLERLPCEAAALYLFLVTVGDAERLSYYVFPLHSQMAHLNVGYLNQSRTMTEACESYFLTIMSLSISHTWRGNAHDTLMPVV